MALVLSVGLCTVTVACCLPSPSKLLAVFLVLNWMCLTAATAPSQRGSRGHNFRLRSSNCHCHGVFISFHTVMAPVAVFFKRQRHLVSVHSQSYQRFLFSLKTELLKVSYFEMYRWAKKNSTYYYNATSSWIVFICFLEEFKTQKLHFEINWPL